jgi:hypothetical protein
MMMMSYRILGCCKLAVPAVEYAKHMASSDIQQLEATLPGENYQIEALDPSFAPCPAGQDPSTDPCGQPFQGDSLDQLETFTGVSIFEAQASGGALSPSSRDQVVQPS